VKGAVSSTIYVSVDGQQPCERLGFLVVKWIVQIVINKQPGLCLVVTFYN
jgi:hypothetical protein